MDQTGTIKAWVCIHRVCHLHAQGFSHVRAFHLLPFYTQCRESCVLPIACIVADEVVNDRRWNHIANVLSIFMLQGLHRPVQCVRAAALVQTHSVDHVVCMCCLGAAMQSQQVLGADDAFSWHQIVKGA